MSRIQKLKTHYKEQLTEHKIKDVSNFIQSIVDTDITKGKYARFLIESFLNDKFLEEDLLGGLNSTVGQTITLFDKYKRKLPLEQRSVYALDKETKLPLYQSPGDLWKSVKQYQGELSGKELKKEEREQIYRETEFIYKDEETGFQIISPLTEESAQWWGKGTRWCTSAEKNNQFENYVKDAPLLILLMPSSAITAGNGNKLQLWKNGNQIQFMDEADKTVTLEYIEKHWNILEPICMWLNDIRFIPMSKQTYKHCENTLKNKINNCFSLINKKFLDENMYSVALENDLISLQIIPQQYLTDIMIQNYIKHSESRIGFLSKQYLTPERCLIFVKLNPSVLLYLPKELRTEELCKLAVQQDGSLLFHIPKEYRTKELCEVAIQNNVKALHSTPEEYLTYDLCEQILYKDCQAIYFIPDKYRNAKMCEYLLSINGEYLHFFADNIKTKELCELAVKKSPVGYALDAVPKKFKTPELCELAVKHSGHALRHVPEELKTKELCELAVQQNGYALQYIPKELITPEICELAVRQDGCSLKYVPKELITKKLCKLAVENNREALCHIPEEYINELKKINKVTLNQDLYNSYLTEFKSIFPKNNLTLNMQLVLKG